MRNRLFWRRAVDPDVIAERAKAWRMSPLAVEILSRRGIHRLEDLEGLRLDLPLSDPKTLPDMDQAVWMIRQVLQQGKRLRVYGDYDADGVTATALLCRGLGLLGYDRLVDYYIPNRFDEGYGLNSEAVLKAHQDGVELLVTVDCGSSSPQAADLARSLGLKLVITDHHALPRRMPDADALVNPERQEPVDRLSGAGVALQLVRALLESEPPEVIYGIAAIGTVADVVPLSGNNRRLVGIGLKALQRGAVSGVNQLFRQEGRDLAHAAASDLGFFLGPRLNAAGRMGDAHVAVQLLLTDSESDAKPVAIRLSELNAERRAVERQVLDEAWKTLPRPPEGGFYPFAVAAGDGWHQGVIGIVASRLREVLRRPVAVISWDGGSGKGSARGIEEFNLIGHLRQSGDLFTKLGGHPGAAGFSLMRQDAGTLSRRLSEGLQEKVRQQQYLGYEYDIAVPAAGLAPDFFHEVSRLEPYGHQFSSPRFLVTGEVERVNTMGQEGRHLSLTLHGSSVRAIGFGLGLYGKSLAPGVPVRLLVTLEANWYKNQVRPQWRIQVLDGPAPFQSQGVKRGMPRPAQGRIIWVVNSPRDQREWGQKLGVQPYLTSAPVGALLGIEEQARRGFIQQLVVSQWRPWPQLWQWADHVIWLVTPRNRRKWEESGQLAHSEGDVWLHPSGHAAQVRAKALRLSLSREKMARHWRRWSTGQGTLLIGRSVFEELDLRPQQRRTGEKRSLDESYVYRRALLDQRDDERCPFDVELLREEEVNGVD